eukprot:TRINITY_DN6020_c0_g2_i1.p1 TRINITY_DN6020_c0_g2~~TRINITY_DN6020_c0_g2_i1.p1  ORF type:complete len:442 (-),score=62.86 TRINITY_DN6020_c0_g2_i1:82-1359(-)
MPSSAMKKVTAASELASIAFRVAMRRAISGPKRPSWSFKFECLAEYLHVKQSTDVEGYSKTVEKLLRDEGWTARLLSGLRSNIDYLSGDAHERVSVYKFNLKPHLSAELLLPTHLTNTPPERITALADDVIHRLPRTTPKTTILYLHGGGYIMGSTKSHRRTVSFFCTASNAKAIVINYRLAPENPFPAGLDDAIFTYRWLLAQPGEHPSRIVIMGDSAGGGLTLATLQQIRNIGLPLPAAGVCLSPWTDLTLSFASWEQNGHLDYVQKVPIEARQPFIDQNDAEGGEPHLGSYGSPFVKLYAGDVPLTNGLVSPLYGDYRNLPPLLIQVGECETLLDDSVHLARQARRHGVDVTLEIYEDMIHVFQAFKQIDSTGKADKAIKQIGQFVQQHAGGNNGTPVVPNRQMKECLHVKTVGVSAVHARL